MPTQRYPDKGNINFEKGINVVDTLLKNKYAQRLRNHEYVNDTLKRRQAFSIYSLLDFSQAIELFYTNPGIFETPGACTGRHEYIDDTDTSRVLHAHESGTIYEGGALGESYADRVSGLTAGQKVRFESFMGACVAVNGADAPRRADGSTWRTFGAPLPVVQASAVTSGAGALPVLTRQAIVVACIRVDGVVRVRSNWSNIQTFTTTAFSAIQWSWAASTDTRVNYYEVYVTEDGLSDPFFLLGGTTGLFIVDNTVDEDLSEQLADADLRNGPAPIAKTVSAAGQRLFMGGLIDATDPDADKTVHASAYAINKWEIEYFPQDGIHKFKLPGAGPLTANIGLGNKDEDDNANDVFFGQKDSCYVLRGADPFKPLETISRQVGPINPDAVAPWKRYLFFVSMQGLEFIGPTGSPINVCEKVKPYFVGGGELNLGGIQGDQYVYLTVDNGKNQLLITLRDDAGARWGNVTLILDLNKFDPNYPDKTARFTTTEGLGTAFYLSLRSRALILFDNQNYILLTRGTGASDATGVYTTALIDAEIDSGHLLGEFPDFRKKLCGMTVITLCDANTALSIERDYGYSAETKTVSQDLQTRLWDKVWDKTWYAARFFHAYVACASIGSFFQTKHHIQNGSADFVFIGYILHFTQVQSKIMGKR